MIESPALTFEQNRPLMVEKLFLLNVKFFVVFQKKKHSYYSLIIKFLVTCFPATFSFYIR